MYGIINGLAEVLDALLLFYKYAVIIAIVLSWVNADPGNGIVQFFRRITEPAFSFVRRRLPFVVVGAFDLSPMVIILIILFLQSALIGNLRVLAQRFL